MNMNTQCEGVRFTPAKNGSDVIPRTGSIAGRYFRLLALLCSVSTVLCGCSGSADSLNRFSVSGTVTFNGEPLQDGTIFFQPDSAKGNSGPGSLGEIKDSQYKIDKTRGVLGGAYIVRITGYEPPPPATGPMPVRRGAALFPEHEQHIEIDPKSRVLDFQIPSPKSRR